MTLTAKEESFCRSIAIDGLGPAAAYRASRDASKMKPASVHSNSKRLMRRSHVKLRIEELRMQAEAGDPDGRGPGRPSEYRTEFAKQAEHLTQLGAIDADLAEFFEVDERTINRWKLQHVGFCQSLKAGKIVADMEVAVKLHKRATGFLHVEQHPIKLKTVEYKDGKKVAESERVEIVEVQRALPPDTAAGIFWLTNRQRKYWKQRVSAEHTGEDGKPLIPESNSRDVARAVLDILRGAQIAQPAEADDEHEIAEAAPRGYTDPKIIEALKNARKIGEDAVVRAATAPVQEQPARPSTLQPGEREVLDNGAEIHYAAQYQKYAIFDSHGTLHGYRRLLDAAREFAATLPPGR